ncbi:MAG: GGDEF domain-containing protein [Oscillospiraceae bacterium]|nr:GGDEF domain-containing protein [Oscillospiraceae bacterium]
MAKKEKKSSYSGRAFRIAGIALAIISILNMIMVYATYTGTSKTFTRTSEEMNHINTANSHLMAANESVLSVVGNVGAKSENDLSAIMANISEIHSHFQTIDYELNQYEKMEDHDEKAFKRFKHARAYVDAYHNKMYEYQRELENLMAPLTNPEATDAEKASAAQALAVFKQTIPDVYQQEIEPLQNAATQMMVASISIGAAAAGKRSAMTIRALYLVLSVMLLILIAGEVTLYLIARYTRRANAEIDRKNAQFAEASSKLMRSREKMEDIAVTNILTGMKNRYALDQDLSDRLADEQFNLAVFDMDNFRSINDMYGYDFGDEYLAQVAERLKSDFGQVAELYSITGNEFCAVFNRDITDSQALLYVERIAASMSAPFTVFNLTVQLSVSASTYHYVAGDCLNVNSLLVKMDNALRNAKRQGGGQIHQVMNI